MRIPPSALSVLTYICADLCVVEAFVPQSSSASSFVARSLPNSAFAPYDGIDNGRLFSTKQANDFDAKKNENNRAVVTDHGILAPQNKRRTRSPNSNDDRSSKTKKDTETNPQQNNAHNNNTPRRESNTSIPAKTNKPWHADYRTSMATQRRIKAAGGEEDRNNVRNNNNNQRNNSRNSKYNNRSNNISNNRNYKGNHNSKRRSNKPPLQLAVNVLETFLQTNPEECNAANLVCSLTLSAKLLTRIHTKHSSNNRLMTKFRSLRAETFNILDQLVSEDLLSPRQLCNSAWAVGKHFGFDNAILPGDGMGLEMGMRERWNLSDDDAESGSDSNDATHSNNKAGAQNRLANTMDEIAIRLTDVLDGYDGVGENVVKVGELTMACWAYASTRPRNVPPGWELPPRVGRVSDAVGGGGGDAAAIVEEASNGHEDVVIFERWDEVAGAGGVGGLSSSSMPMVGSQRQAESKSDRIMDNLFDAVANTLCWEQEDTSIEDTELTSGTDDAHPSPPPTTLLRECPWKDLSIIAWSFATRGHFGSKSTEYLITAAVEDASRRLDEAPRGAPSNNNHNRKRGGYRGQKNSRSNKNDRKSRFIPRDVAQLVWAVGVLQSDNYRLGDSLVALVGAINRHWIGLGVDKHYDDHYRPFENWRTADLVQLAVALSHGRIDDVSLLSEIYGEAFHIVRMSEEVEQKGTKFRRSNEGNRHWQSWELSIMLWVQANLYLTSKQGDVFREFAETVPRTLLQRMNRLAANGNEIAAIESIGLGSQEQANVAWSLTVLEEHFSQESEELLRSIFQSASSSYTSGAFIRLENAHQLWQAYYLLEKDCPEAVAGVVSKNFRDYLERTWSAEKSRQKISSARHRSLSQTLNLMGVAHYNEHHEDIDVAIILKDESPWTHTAERRNHEESHHKVAVEFDGPNHFTRMNGGKPRALGHTVLKYRILKKQGWTVVRVPYYEFDKIPFWASMERQRYLQRLLKTHADIQFSEIDRSEYKPPVPSRQTRFD